MITPRNRAADSARYYWCVEPGINETIKLNSVGHFWSAVVYQDRKSYGVAKRYCGQRSWRELNSYIGLALVDSGRGCCCRAISECDRDVERTDKNEYIGIDRKSVV